MLKNQLTLAFRNLIRNKSFSIINITGLSIGITCCIVMLIFVRYELSFDSFHRQAANTFRVVQHTRFPEQTLYWNTTAYPLAEALRNDFSDFSMVSQTSGPVTRTFSIDDGTGSINRFEEKLVLFVDPWYPKVFDLQWLAGNPETALNDPNAAVLTESLIKKCFRKEISDPDEVIGKTILLNGKDPLIITGVVKNSPGNTNLQYNILVPYAFFRMNNNYFANNWSGNYQGTTFVVLNDKAAEKHLEKKIATWKKKYLKPEDDSRISYFLQPLREIHNETQYGSSPGGYTMPYYIVNAATAIAVFILIIASVNFVNLATALAATRAKEVGIRKVIGSTRSKLVVQFIGENTLLILVTLFISVALSQLSIAQLNDFLSMLNLKLAFHWGDAVIIVAVGIAVILLSALYPAFVLSSYRPIEALKNKSLPGQSRGASLRKGLIIVQFAIVQFFIIATLIVAVQMNFIKNKALGFTSEAVIMLSSPEAQQMDAFRQKLMEFNSVTDITFGAGPPQSVYEIRYGTTFRLPHQPEDEGQECEMKAGDQHYVPFFGLELLAGKNFTSAKDEFDEFIVNEKLVKAMGWKPDEAIGRRLRMNEGEATIVGVMKDFHNSSLQDAITPCILVNWAAFRERTFVKIESQAGISGSLEYIEKVWKEFRPAGVYKYDFVDDLIEKNYAVERLTFLGFTTFAVIAVLIGCLGLFGLMSFMTIRKTKEVGIRKVLGATVAQIVALFSKEFVLLVTIAFCMAAPVVYYIMERWLSNFTYRVPLSWWIFAAGGMLALFIAMISVSYQSIRAAMANPVESLKNE